MVKKINGEEENEFITWVRVGLKNPPLVMANGAPWDGLFNPTLTIYSYMIPLSIRKITDFYHGFAMYSIQMD